MSFKPRISFSQYWPKLDVNERVEKLVRDVIIGQSELKTLTDSYKNVIASHMCDLEKIVKKENMELDEKNKEMLKEFDQLTDQIENNTDVVVVDTVFAKFCKIYDALKMEDNQITDLKGRLNLIRKLNERFFNWQQKRLDEYCQRIMIMTEVQRDRKRNFSDSLEKEIDKIKQELLKSVTEDFQKMRVDKLKSYTSTIEEKHIQYYNSRLDAYKDVIERHKVLNMHVFQLENQLRSLKFAKRKAPYEHDVEVEELNKTVEMLHLKMKELEEKLKNTQESRTKSVVVARREKIKINIELSKLLAETARSQARLCKMTNLALRRKLSVPKEIVDSVCTNSDNCNCSKT